MRYALTTAVAALCLSFSLRAQDQSWADCVVKASSAWGRPCEKCENYKGWKRDFSGTYQVALKNACNEMLEVKVAVEETGGAWRTFPVRTLAPGDSLNAFACHGTGKYLYWARRINDTEIILPTDGEIVSNWRGN